IDLCGIYFLLMDALLIVIGVILGGCVTLLTLKPKLSRVEAESAAYRIKAEDTERVRQRLDVELSGVRVEAKRITEMTAILKERDLTITDLERRCSSLSTS